MFSSANAGTVEVDVLGNWDAFKRQTRDVGGPLEREIATSVDKGAEQGGRKATGTLKRHGSDAGRGFGSSFKTAFGGIAAGLGAYIGVNFLQSASSEASGLAEAQAKVGQVFKESAGDIQTWSKSSAKNIQVSQKKALQAAGTYGNLLVSAFKVSRVEAAKMSKRLVELAGDMASFNDVPVDDALQALQSGLSGETEPLKRFGVNLNVAAVKAKALEMGLISNTKDALEPAAQAQAIYNLILENTADQQGDIARTGKGYAGQLKEFQANWENLKGTLAVGVLPALTGVLTAMNAIGPSGMQMIITIGLAAFAFGKLATVAQGAAGAVSLLFANPVIAGILLLGLTVFGIIKYWDQISNAIKKAYEWLRLFLGLKERSSTPSAAVGGAGTSVAIVGDPKALPGSKAATSKAPLSLTAGLNPTLGFADGGLVPGRLGQPLVATVHGGEYVLSNRDLRELAGMRAAADASPIHVQVIVQGAQPNIDWDREARKAGEALQREQLRRSRSGQPAAYR